MVLWHWIYNFVISTMQSQSLSTTSNKLFHYKAIYLILWFIWCDILHVRHARCIKLRAMVMFGLCFFSFWVLPGTYKHLTKSGWTLWFLWSKPMPFSGMQVIFEKSIASLWYRIPDVSRFLIGLFGSVRWPP